jgi:hypothetical protein
MGRTGKRKLGSFTNNEFCGWNDQISGHGRSHRRSIDIMRLKQITKQQVSELIECG